MEWSPIIDKGEVGLETDLEEDILMHVSPEDVSEMRSELCSKAVAASAAAAHSWKAPEPETLPPRMPVDLAEDYDGEMEAQSACWIEKEALLLRDNPPAVMSGRFS